MNPDRITVDEPLISTDVDSLIRTIAERKKVNLSDLRKTCNIDKKNMDKWISVLEDEGYISIEYGIRGTFIHWTGEDHPPEYSVEEPQEAQYDPFGESGPGEDEPEPVEPESAGENEFSQEMPLDESDDSPAEEEEIAVEEEPDPEELLSEYLAKRREGEAPDTEELKSNILNSLEDEASDSPIEPDLPSKPEEPELPDDPEEPEEPEDQGLDFTRLEEADEPEVDLDRLPTQTLRPTVQPRRAMASDIRELMSSYMQEINREKAAIQALKKEKESLYRDKYAALEGRMQADLVALTERIIEKQSRLAELKEHVLELPDKVGEVERIQGQMDSLKAESAAALARTRQKAETFVAGIEDSREELRARIEELNSSVEAQSDKLMELEGLSESLDSQSDKLRLTIEETQAKVEGLNSQMSALSGDLTKVEGMKEGILDMKDAIKDIVASHGEELQSLEEELEGIAKVEQWVAEYLRDYESKISDIEGYVTHSDQELAELKEAAESLYVKKYLGELEDMTQAYESGLDDAISAEKDIDTRIAESKARITELVKESKEMMHKLQSEVSEPDEFDTVLTKVKRKTARAKKVVEEKRKERVKLSEDSKSARRTRRTEKTRKAKAKVKPRAKKKPKKKRK